MEKKICIHKYGKEYDHVLQKLHEKGLSKKNLDTVLRFRDVCLLNNMSKPRIIKYFRFFFFLFKFFKKDLEDATKEDIEKIVATINAKETFAPATKHDYKVLLRRFYKWLKGKDEEYPPEVKWIKSVVKRTDKKLAGDGELITQEDVAKLIETSEYSRDRAFVSLLYESGCRIGEIGSMKIGSINFDKYGTVITVSGKTGPRKIRVISSTSYLRTWLNAHPFKDDKDKPLWVNFGARSHNQAMDYPGFKIMLTRLFKKAGISKKSNPHLFRHSRATYMANHLTEFQMNQYFGWVQGSDMPATYVHLSGRDIDKAVLEMNGLKSKKEEKEEAKVKVCPRCDSINDAKAIYCGKCSFVLDEKEAVRIETEKREKELRAELARGFLKELAQEMPEVRERLAEKIKNLKQF